MMAILRRKRDRSSPPPKPTLNIRPSLSLPDLTSPLLDPASWEELPFLPSPSFPISPSQQHPNYTQTYPVKGRGRAPSLVGTSDQTNTPGTPVQFHRPFTPWQVVNDPLALARLGDGSIGNGHGQGGERGGHNYRDSYITVSTVSGGLVGERRGRGRGKNKVLGKLNVVVVGGKGVGKTSFVNLLADSLESSSREMNHTLDPSSSTLSPATITPALTPSSPTTPGPPISQGTSQNHTRVPPKALKPTTKLSSRTIKVNTPGYERSLLRLIDTPGLELGQDELGDRERERGVRGLLRLLEERLAETLREESRIVRRGPRADDDLVHLVIYLIDARVILRPIAERSSAPLDVDWSSIGLFDDTPTDPIEESVPRQPPQISTTEIDIIRKLSTRANVLPILTHSDALTISELESVKSVVRRDLALAFGEGKIDSPGKGFGVFFDIDAEDEEEDDDHSLETVNNKNPMEVDIRPPTPASTTPSREERPSKLPFAIFAPETSVTPSDPNTKFTRKYSWGEANVLNAEESDFVLLRDTILGTHTKILKTTTREVLYEQFRTERLLAKHATLSPAAEREKLLRDIQRV